MSAPPSSSEPPAAAAPHCPRCGARMGALHPERAPDAAASPVEAWYCGCCGLVQPAVTAAPAASPSDGAPR